MGFKKFFRLVIICIIFPFIIHYIAYFGFISNYGKNVYSVNSFKNHYESGLYRFRFLGRLLQLKTYELVKKNTELEDKQSPYVQYLDKNGDDAFYLTYFLVNVIFNILSSIVIFLTFSNRKIFSLPEKMVNIYTLIAIFLTGFTLYVITPYDALSYFLIMLGCNFILQLLLKPSVITFLFLLFTLCICTITRESSAILLSFFAALLFIFQVSLPKKLYYFRLLFLSVLSYLLVYIFLRIRLGFGNGFYQSGIIMYLNNLTNLNPIIGGLFFIVAAYFIHSFAEKNENRKLFFTFLIFCSPYLFFCWFTGIFFETRLWIPVLLPALVLINIDFNKLKENWTKKTEPA